MPTTTLVQRERTLTPSDHARLARLAGSSEPLQDLLAASDLVPQRAVPPTLVTMGTRVLLQDAAGAAPAYELTVCYPADSAPARGFVSVLSPVGGALLGLHVGETACWSGPDGRSGAARILAVLSQPEAGGEGAS